MGLVLTPAMTLLPWVLSKHQEPEAPPCLYLAGLGSIFSARICAVVFSTCSACSVFLSGASICLSHTPLTVAAIFLWSSAPSLPSLLSWNLWGSGSELCLFPKLPRCTLSLTFPMFAVCPRFPPVLAFLIRFPVSPLCLPSPTVSVCLFRLPLMVPALAL